MSVLDELRAMEPIFHTEAFRRAARMADAYWEVGASGCMYTRAFIEKHLADDPPVDADEAGWSISDCALLELGAGTFLLTYQLDQAGRLSRRSTLWQRDAEGWSILYHQGTSIGPA